MKYRKITGIAAPIVLIALFCAPLARAESISISEYQQQLHDTVAKVESLEDHPENAGRVVASIPDQVSVATGSGEIKVSYKVLKDSLAAFTAADESKRPALLQQAQQYARAMNSAAEDYDKRAADPGPAHRQLEEILSRREFKTKGPTAKDALLARIYYWIARFLSKLIFKGQASFDLMRLIIYLLVGAAATLLLLWTIRRLRRPQEDLPQREIIPFAPSARSWRAWLADAPYAGAKRGLAKRNSSGLLGRHLLPGRAWRMETESRADATRVSAPDRQGCGPISSAGGANAQTGNRMVRLRHGRRSRFSRSAGPA